MDLKKIINNPGIKNVKYYLSSFNWQDIGKDISAYANNNGGFLFFGFAFDGNKAIPKGFPYQFKLSEILDEFNNPEVISYGSENYEGCKIYYIEIFDSFEIIKFRDIPYVLDEGKNVIQLEPKKIFLSYTWDDTNIVDILQADLNKKYQDRITITRDRDSLGYKDSLEEFMGRVKDHDYVISIISDSYLKSSACMYEIGELMRDRGYFEKLLFITIKEEDLEYYECKRNKEKLPSIYGYEYTKYKMYWEEKRKKLESESEKIGLSNMVLLANDAKQIQLINFNLDDLLSRLRDSIGKGFNQLKEEDYQDFDFFYS